MKTILAPRGTIARLWGNPEPRDVPYREMKYLLHVEVEEGTLLHNVVTGQMILLTREEANILTQLPASPKGIMPELIRDHFLVPGDYDEYRSVQQLRAILRKQPTDGAVNHYVILPTTFCNAHCFYCYESDYPRVHMTEETAGRVVDYIAEHRGNRDVTINWFGGEPLVGIERIDQISKGLEDRGIPFTSSMISNGYLFDEAVCDRSVQLWKLKRVQITLDGTRDTYNRVKAYVNAGEDPYERVLRNIDLLSARGIHVNIRLNVDLYNREEIRLLIEELGGRYGENQHVTAYLNMLFNDSGYEPVKHTLDDMIVLTDIIDAYTKRLKELKMSFDDQKKLHLLSDHCMADNPHTLMIQPDGSFCRCEHENILDSYGDLERGVTDAQKLAAWQETVEPSADCPGCAVYPACYHLRKCMNSDVPCTERLRTKTQKQQKDRIRAIYERKMEVTKDEGI